MKKIAMVTGATSGIGEACARKFAQGGYDIIITGRNSERLRAVDEELTQTAQWLMEQIPQPTYGSVGGEWAVFGLARSGVAVPKEYFEVLLYISHTVL